MGYEVGELELRGSNLLVRKQRMLLQIFKIKNHQFEKRKPHNYYAHCVQIRTRAISFFAKINAQLSFSWRLKKVEQWKRTVDDPAAPFDVEGRAVDEILIFFILLYLFSSAVWKVSHGAWERLRVSSRKSVMCQSWGEIRRKCGAVCLSWKIW